jgi:hypothetical protein
MKRSPVITESRQLTVEYLCNAFTTNLPSQRLVQKLRYIPERTYEWLLLSTERHVANC